MLRIAAIVMLVVACSGHALMRDTVVMKISPTEAHVCLHPGTFAVGDRVNIFTMTCQMRIDRAVDCRRDVVGRGRITRVINDHYAAVEVAAQRLEEGLGVEVLRSR